MDIRYPYHNCLSFYKAGYFKLTSVKIRYLFIKTFAESE